MQASALPNVRSAMHMPNQNSPTPYRPLAQPRIALFQVQTHESFSKPVVFHHHSNSVQTNPLPHPCLKALCSNRPFYPPHQSDLPKHMPKLSIAQHTQFTAKNHQTIMSQFSKQIFAIEGYLENNELYLFLFLLK